MEKKAKTNKPYEIFKKNGKFYIKMNLFGGATLLRWTGEEWDFDTIEEAKDWIAGEDAIREYIAKNIDKFPTSKDMKEFGI